MFAFPPLENLVMRSLRIGRCIVIPVVLMATLVAAVSAQDVHYDVFVTSSDSSLVIGGYDDAATTATVPADQMRVFGGEVVPATGTAAPYESASPGEPGFRAATQSFLNNPSLTTPAGVYTALPGSTPLTFSFLPISIGSDSRNLFYWSGTGKRRLRAGRRRRVTRPHQTGRRRLDDRHQRILGRGDRRQHHSGDVGGRTPRERCTRTCSRRSPRPEPLQTRASISMPCNLE